MVIGKLHLDDTRTHNVVQDFLELNCDGRDLAVILVTQW